MNEKESAKIIECGLFGDMKEVLINHIEFPPVAVSKIEELTIHLDGTVTVNRKVRYKL